MQVSSIREQKECLAAGRGAGLNHMLQFKIERWIYVDLELRAIIACPHTTVPNKRLPGHH